MIEFDNARRRFVAASGAGLLLARSITSIACATEKKTESEDKEVGAVEDLMREHGVIRRTILVYRTIANRLRSKPSGFDSDVLRRAATLFRAFGEDYHERKLEEEHIFPIIKKAGGPAATYVDILIAQHERGRELTDYILGISGKGGIGTEEAEKLARVLDDIELMYQHHAAREDTVVFPAWKNALSAHQLDEMGELFEEIEHKQFGADGFDDAVAEIGKIEEALSIADISQFTPERLAGR